MWTSQWRRSSRQNDEWELDYSLIRVCKAVLEFLEVVVLEVVIGICFDRVHGLLS